MLIGLTLIAIVLSIAIPQVQKVKDRGLLQRASESLNSLNKEILEISDVAGNVRLFFFSFEKGKLVINSTDDTITYILENTNVKFSEPGKKIPYGDLMYETRLYGKRYDVLVSLNYSSIFDITFQGQPATKVLHGGIYQIKIENVGDNQLNQPVHLDLGLA
jgi:type II secretory pathway pseudopilin PulG